VRGVLSSSHAHGQWSSAGDMANKRQMTSNDASKRRYGRGSHCRYRPCLSVCMCMVRRSVSYVDMLRRRCGAGQWQRVNSLVDRGERALTAFSNPDY
jgi:hypothetical protein